MRTGFPNDFAIEHQRQCQIHDQHRPCGFRDFQFHQPVRTVGETSLRFANRGRPGDQRAGNQIERRQDADAMLSPGDGGIQQHRHRQGCALPQQGRVATIGHRMSKLKRHAERQRQHEEFDDESRGRRRKIEKVVAPRMINPSLVASGKVHQIAGHCRPQRIILQRFFAEHAL